MTVGSEAQEPGVARGVRNNNPCNVRRGPDRWRGQDWEQEDPDFVTFVAAVYGLRAAARVLYRYATRDRVTTLRGLSHRWAPASDGNDPEAYAAYLARLTSFDPDAYLDLANPLTIRRVLPAVVIAECGSDPYLPEEYEDAIRLAGIGYGADP
jgi:hypothetical protein